ncbi:MAG: DUF4262 domain-containing protein [Chitinophagales bacterium]
MKEENHNCISLNQTKEHIEKYGLSVVKIESSRYLPSFAYSIGLTETFNHPEIICFGLRTQLLHELINDVAEIIRFEGKLNPDKEYDNIFNNSRAKFLPIDKRNIEDYFKVAIKYFGTTDIKGLQLIWTDRNNKFPWENGFEEVFKFNQPLLDRNAEFKFREEKNLGIFTTRQWLEDNQPIVRVIHEEDGDWQFLTENIDFENGKVVALEQMTLRDQTLNDLFDLEYGEEAERDFIGDKWKRNKFKSD